MFCCAAALYSGSVGLYATSGSASQHAARLDAACGLALLRPADTYGAAYNARPYVNVGRQVYRYFSQLHYCAFKENYSWGILAVNDKHGFVSVRIRPITPYKETNLLRYCYFKKRSGNFTFVFIKIVQSFELLAVKEMCPFHLVSVYESHNHKNNESPFPKTKFVTQNKNKKIVPYIVTFGCQTNLLFQLIDLQWLSLKFYLA